MPATVQRGSANQDVVKLQQLLNRVLTVQQMRDAGVRNPPLATDGVFGPNTQAAVTYYKTKNGLTGGSVVGPTTWQHLERTAQNSGTQGAGGNNAGGNNTGGNNTGADVRPDNNGLPDTRGKSEAEKFDIYYQIMQRVRRGNVNVANQALAGGKQVILGLRKVDVLSWHGVYNDRCILLRNAGGTKSAIEHQYNTEPNSRYRSRRSDLGRISEGVWEYYVGRHGISSLSDKRALIPVRGTGADRDNNADGRYTGSEIGSSTSPDMLFHIGGRGDVGSMGCQTFHPSVWPTFWGNLNLSQRNFWYVLINYC